MDTFIAITIYIFLVLGIISFVNMIDELFFGGVISDAIEWVLDKVADLYWFVVDKSKGDRDEK